MEAAHTLASARRIVDNPGMNDTTQLPSGLPELPDHLSIDPRSPHHDAKVFEHPVGIRFNGKERTDVEEYCISEGWIKVAAGKTLDRKGRPMLIKLKGTVEAYYAI
jgi:hypothetical protein